MTFTLPAHLKDKCPYQLSMAQGIKIHPVLFTKGTLQLVNMFIRSYIIKKFSVLQAPFF